MTQKTIKLPLSAGSYDIVVGIDPDKSKSGVAYLSVKDRHLELAATSFVDTLDYLSYLKQSINKYNSKVIVVIEGGWLNKSCWHVATQDTKAVAAKKGYAVGQNHQTGMFLQEFCEKIDLPCKVVRPLRKCWHGENRKITHEELVNITGIQARRTNQEERDAALLAWVEAKLPIFIKPTSDKYL